MEMYIWKWSDVISIYHKKIWKIADIHIKGMKHMPFCYQINILWHCIRIVGFTGKEYRMVRLENVGDVLFQTLLLDAINFVNGKVQADLCTITRLQDSALV